MTRGVTQTLLRQVTDEMDGSDRATAVVGGTFVEEQLTRLLKIRMVKNEKVIEELFGRGRAFSDLGSHHDITLSYTILCHIIFFHA
jgi:hypothetical protein